MNRYKSIDIAGNSGSTRQPATAIGSAFITTRKCIKCTDDQIKIDSRSRSIVWYCSKCDVYEETTIEGAHLRHYLQKPTVITTQESNDS